MERIFKILIVAVAISFIIPQMTLAAWWDPFSWGIWNVFNIFQTQKNTKVSTNKISPITASTTQQLYSITKNSSENYVLSRKINISDSSYSIKKDGSYDLLTFSDYPQDYKISNLYDGSRPNLPLYEFEIPLPLDAKIQNVKVDFGAKKFLGKLNLPTINPQALINCPGCSSGPTYLPHPQSGIVPETAYDFRTANMGNFKDLFVTVYPVTYDNSNGDTYVYSGFQINAEYTTANQVIIDKIQPEESGSFNSGEDITVYALVKNITSDSSDITVSVDLLAMKNGFNDKISFNQSRQVIFGNATGTISTIIKVPEKSENKDILGYEFNVDVSNGKNKIYSKKMPVDIKQSAYVDINCFNYPSRVDYQPSGSYGFYTFEACLTNPTKQKIRAYININMSLGEGGALVHLPQSYIDLNPGEAGNSKITWIPGNPDMRSGQYTVTMVASVGEYKTYKTGFFQYSSEVKK